MSPCFNVQDSSPSTLYLPAQTARVYRKIKRLLNVRYASDTPRCNGPRFLLRHKAWISVVSLFVEIIVRVDGLDKSRARAQSAHL